MILALNENFSAVLFGTFKRSTYFCSAKQLVIHSLRRASGKFAQLVLGIFYVLTLRYWRLPICVDYQSSRSGDHLFSSANGDRFLVTYNF